MLQELQNRSNYLLNFLCLNLQSLDLYFKTILVNRGREADLSFIFRSFV